MEDSDLLRRYLADRSEAAFAQLVSRHVDLVYGAALRQMGGDHHRAQEVTQMTFIALARKAAALARHPVLPAWLHRAVGFAASELRRKEARRARHEQAAAAFEPAAPENEIDWGRIRPVLDDAIGQLGERDREAVVLRFFANRPFAEVGRRLGLSENAARMRVDRALEKLRTRLERRGIASTCAALAAGLTGEAAIAAPAGVAPAIAAAGAAAGGSAAAGGLLFFMSMNKALVGAAGAILTTGAVLVNVQQRANVRMEAQLRRLQSQSADLPALRREARELSASRREIQDLVASNQDGPRLSAQIQAAQKELEHLRAEAAAKAALAKQTRIAGASGFLSGEVYDISKLDRIPIVVTEAPPQFPVEMRQAGVNGTVVVDFIVDANGYVHNAMAASSTSPEFEQSAVQAVSQWTFQPGAKSGRAVNTHMQVPIVFTVVDDSATAGQPQPVAPPPSDWFPGGS